MPRVRRISRFLLSISLVLLLTAGITVSAAEQLIARQYIKITEDNQVVDSLNGVDALYNLGSSNTLWCTELVSRYYETLYGIEIYYGANGPSVRGNSDYWFEELSEDELPQTGDVLFGSAAQRGRNSDHWAIVKAYDSYHEKIQVFEQNWRYNGAAGVGRELDYPTEYYRIYRLYTTSGAAEPALSAEDRPSSEEAATAVQLANQLGIAVVADGLQDSISAEDFFSMCCNTIRAAGGSSTLADPEDPIAAAVQLGLISEGSWSKEDVVTRENACIVLVRLAMLLSAQPTVEEDVLSQYPDAEEVTASCRDYVSRAYAFGLMEGTLIRPQESLTVEEAILSLTDLAVQPQRDVVISSAAESIDTVEEVGSSSLAADAAAALVGSLAPQN